MKMATVVSVILVGLAMCWGSHLYAADKDVDNIQVDIKIVVSEKNKEDETYTYTIVAENGKDLCWHQGKRIPWTSEVVTETKDGDIQTEKQTEFLDIGVSIGLTAVNIDGGSIRLRSMIESSKLAGKTEDNLPVISRFQIEQTNIHKNAEFLKVFSGDYLEADQSVDLYIKAATAEAKKKAAR